MRSGEIAVLVGAFVGIVLAFVRPTSTEPPHAHPPPPITTPSAAPPVTTPNAAAPPVTTPSAAAPPVTTPSAPTPSATASVAPASSVPAGPTVAPLVFPLVAPLPAVTTPKELERSELVCYERKEPDECERAADGYAAGLSGKPEPERAARLRKVAITFLVRRCEDDRSPHACLALAGRYKTGQGVPANDRKAFALLAHARQLCRERPRRQECIAGEPR